MENVIYSGLQQPPVASFPLEGQHDPFRVNLPPHQVPCRYFLSGYCARSDSCWFQHEVQGLKIQKLKLKTVVKPAEENGEKPVPLLPSEVMVQGQGKAAVRQWRTEFWSAKVADARANKRKLDVERQGPASKRSKVMQDTGRILASNDMLGESARKVARAKEERKVILVKEAVEEPGVPIPSDPESCPICTETPKIFGLMSACDHIFCLECIRSWRSADKMNKTCPICRMKSAFVVPSSVYPYPPGRKGNSDTQGTGQIERDDANGESSSRKSTPRRVQNNSTINSVKDGTDTEGEDSRDNSARGDTTKDGETPSTGTKPARKKRSRKKNQSKADPNPAKTRIIQNYLAKMKTIPCKYFCDPKKAKTIMVDEKWHSLVWGAKDSRKRNIPFCRYGNDCHYSHPHPEKVEEEYKYSLQELDRLGIKRKKPGSRQDDAAVPEDFVDPEQLFFTEADGRFVFWPRHAIVF